MTFGRLTQSAIFRRITLTVVSCILLIFWTVPAVVSRLDSQASDVSEADAESALVDRVLGPERREWIGCEEPGVSFPSGHPVNWASMSVCNAQVHISIRYEAPVFIGRHSLSVVLQTPKCFLDGSFDDPRLRYVQFGPAFFDQPNVEQVEHVRRIIATKLEGLYPQCGDAVSAEKVLTPEFSCALEEMAARYWRNAPYPESDPEERSFCREWKTSLQR